MTMDEFETYNELEEYFSQIYIKLGIEQYNFCYIYSDFRFFASCMKINLDKDRFCKSIVNPLVNLKKTVIIPTFSYTTEGIFDVEKTSTSIGTLNSWILRQPSVKRSEHPLFSFAAIGHDSSLVENCGKSAFGKNSIHDNLRNKKCCFINIGRPIESGNTIIHNIEQSCNAKYRFNKVFKTSVFKNNKLFGSNYSAFVRRQDVPGHDFKFNFTRAAKLIYDEGIVNEVGDPTMLSNVSLYDFDKTREILVKAFLNDTSIFLSKPFTEY
jgi:aminoglycoside N3'-acetyltransferase